MEKLYTNSIMHKESHGYIMEVVLWKDAEEEIAKAKEETRKLKLWLGSIKTLIDSNNNVLERFRLTLNITGVIKLFKVVNIMCNKALKGE